MTPDAVPRTSLAAWTAWQAEQIAGIHGAGQWRAPRAFDARGPSGIVDSRHVINFASNDYLGLSHDPAVIAAAHAALDKWGAGSGASRLVVGTRPVHHELELALAEWKQCERAVVFPTGFAANLGVLTVLAGPDVTVLSDELNHASIIDGCRLSKGRLQVYRHNDIDHLTELLAASSGRVIVVTDSVFSMDGDAVDLDALIAVTLDRGALLVLDEAHAVLGPDIDGRTPDHVVRVGTLSKTLGSLGGFVAASASIVDLLINRARSYIFTTATTPPDAAAALAALHVCESSHGDVLRIHLRSLIEQMRPGHPSPVIPVVLGDEAAALAATAALFERGLWVPAIRPPTVAPGTSRLRVALSADHTSHNVDALITALGEIGVDR